jgi:hypothetical protein
LPGEIEVQRGLLVEHWHQPILQGIGTARRACWAPANAGR